MSTPRTIYLTSVSTWFVPLDFNSSNNTVECWGGGAGGSNLTGGGGGAHAARDNVQLTPGTIISVFVAGGGTSGQDGGDTWISGIDVLAKGGRTNGLGGQANESAGSRRYSGGNGGGGSVAGGGGGGGAGSTENGSNGASTSTSDGGNGGNGGSPNGGSGGAGGVNNNGSNGFNSTQLGEFGAGGGGGGGGRSSDKDQSLLNGGDGGQYGAGGGGGSIGGRGGPGLIKITYVPVASNGYQRVISYDTPGTYSWTIPNNVTNLIIQIWGGGGAGQYWPDLSSANDWFGQKGGDTTISGPFVGGSATAVGGNGGVGDIAALGGGASVPAGWITGNGGNGIVARFGSAGGNGGLDGGNGGSGIFSNGPNAQIPGGGGAGWSNRNDNRNGRSVSSGGGGGAAFYSWSSPPAGGVLNFTVGEGGVNPFVSVTSIPQLFGAGGSVVISYTTQPEVVPTGLDVVPGKPAGPISFSKMSQSFLTFGDNSATNPISISSYYPNNITSRGHASSPGSINRNVRVLRYGYGIQKEPNYTQSIPNSGPISWGDFSGTYQQLTMREPRLVTAANNFEPPFQTYAQYDIVQYQFTGQPQTFQFYNARVIMIECWGAYGTSGRTNDFYTLGGYSAGIYAAPFGGELYVYVGSVGGNPITDGYSAGGWNGGGYGWTFGLNNRGAGGGATDVRTIRIDTVQPVYQLPVPVGRTTIRAVQNTSYWGTPTDPTTGSAYASLASRIIVAGGGGGGLYVPGSFQYFGGAGGGETGANSPPVPGNPIATGGTQSAGGQTISDTTFGKYGPDGGFGYGGSSWGWLSGDIYATIAGGGGGWYGGGASAGAAGGSGYVLGMLPNTATGSQNFGITTVNAQPGQTGYISNPSAPNGLVRITIIG
jgi:hypothetical protein